MTESVRARRVRERRGSGPKQLPWRRVENNFRPMEVLSSEQVERIHLASLKLLAEFGLLASPVGPEEAYLPRMGE